MPLARPAGAAVAAALAATLTLQAQAPAAPAAPSRDSVYRLMLGFSRLVRGGAIEPHWMADGRSFWYVEGAPDQTTALKVDPEANTSTPLLDQPRVRTALTRALGHEPPYQGLPFASFELVDGERAIRFELEGKPFRLELATYQVQALPALSDADRERVRPRSSPREYPSPTGRWFAYIRDGNIWLRSPEDNRSIQLTTDGADRFGWAIDPNSRSPAPVLWAPGGNRLLAFKSDMRKVRHLPVVHWLKPEEEQIDWVVYPHAGGAVPQSELYVLDAYDRSAVKLDSGNEPDRQLVPVAWRGDGSEVLFLRLDRLMKHLDLMAADPATGRSRVILTERQGTFIDGLALNPGNLFAAVEGNRFVWRSERDGWSHLYLYQLDGTLLRRLTQGDWPVDSVAAVDDRGGWVYFLAQGDRQRPYDLHLYRVDLEGRRLARLTEATGEHAVRVAPGKQYFLDIHSTVARPPAVELRRVDGTLVRTLSTADISSLTALGWRAPEEFAAKAADGVTDLYGVLYRPHDFDPARRYPVIDFQYMGNFTHMTPRRFLGTWLGDEAQALTQLGFLVFIVDGRGTTGRGKGFQDFTYRSIGAIEIPDHVAVLRQLAAARPYLDTTRVGITGYSWGGYYTLRGLLTAPEIFKVGVSGAPVVDLLAHPAPIEPYMGLPQDNPEGYARASNLPLAGRLQGKLLLVIGTSDVNVTFNHSMRLAQALIQAGKRFDLIVMPEEAHGLTPSAQAYYLEARARYFVEHLQASER